MFRWTAAVFAAAFTFHVQAADRAQNVLPSPKSVIDLGGDYVLPAGSEIAVSLEALGEARLLADDLGGAHVRTDFSKGARIRLRVLTNWTDRDLGAEGYTLRIDSTGVEATAVSTAGLFYATQTLLQLGHHVAGGLSLPQILIEDWPDIEKRMMQYDVGRGNTVNIEYWKRWIRELARVKINQIMFYMEDDYAYRKYPFMGRKDTFTKAKVDELVAYANARHVELIPELESFGHAEAILSHRQFKSLQLPDNASTFSPCTDGTYNLLGDLYSELIPRFKNAPMFHIGADEVWGIESDPRCKAKLDAGGVPLVYAGHINRLNGIVKTFGRKTAIWGDIILLMPEITKYLDRDLTVFDWHYEEDHGFTSLKQFQNWGFTDIYATPAVYGYEDVYPQYPITFGNIAGFTREALQAGVKKVCVTIWEMRQGGNAENYLYGIAYGAQVMWSSAASDAAEFNSRFARAWFGLDGDHASDIDRAFWFPWRESGSSVPLEKDIDGYWQKLFSPSGLWQQKFAEFTMEVSNDDLATRLLESEKLLKRTEDAGLAVRHLGGLAKRNAMTITALENAIRLDRHIARKSLVMDRLAFDYRAAFARGNRAAMTAELKTAVAGLVDLKADFAPLKAAFAELIRDTNADATDLQTTKTLESDLDAYVRKLRHAEHGLSATPADLGLAPSQSVSN